MSQSLSDTLRDNLRQDGLEDKYDWLLEAVRDLEQENEKFKKQIVKMQTCISVGRYQVMR